MESPKTWPKDGTKEHTEMLKEIVKNKPGEMSAWTVLIWNTLEDSMQDESKAWEEISNVISHINVENTGLTIEELNEKVKRFFDEEVVNFKKTTGAYPKRDNL